MPLTIELARAGFQNSIPHRRKQFEGNVKERLRSIAHEAQYQSRYPSEILQMAEKEVRERHLMASERVKQLLDSGWRPSHPSGVRSAFIDMFTSFDDWQKDPSSDLYHAVEAAFGEVGSRAPDHALVNARQLGTAQVQAANECVSDLECYAGAKRYVDFSAPCTADVNATVQVTNEGPWQYDAFISHASEDKVPFVNDLARALEARGLKIWYDAYELKVGDSLRESIDHGLLSSRYGIAVLSKAFFRKDWPKSELEGLFARQSRDGVKVILPLWHELSGAEIINHSPMLAGRLAARSSDGLEQVVNELLAVIQPNPDRRRS